MSKIVSLAIVLSLVSQLQAQVYKYSNEFLNNGIGARSFGMGGAVIASTADAYAGYWNPAALTEIKDNLQVAFMHNEHFAGIAKHDFGAITFKPNDKSVMAVSIIRYGIDDIPNTLNLFQNGQINYNNITSFSAVDYAFIASYAHQTKIKGIQLGGNVKIIRRVVGEFANAWGFGFDLASKYQKDKLTLAAVLRDVTSTFNAWQYTFTEADKQILVTSGNQLPSNGLEITLPKLIAGAAYKWQLFDKKISVKPEINADFTFDGRRNTTISTRAGSVDFKYGVETSYKDFVFLRGGLNQFQKTKELNGQTNYSFVPSIGIGIQLKTLTIDYALADVGEASGLLPFSNIISVRLNINRKVELPN